MRRIANQLAQQPRPAMTLIETLAVIVIISMVTGALGMSLSGNSRAAQMRATMARWRDLDAQARIAAQIEGTVRLEFNQDHRGITLCVVGTGEAIGALRFQDGCEGSITKADGESVSSINIDARGRSADYTMSLSDVDGQRIGSQRIAQVRGLTGWFVQEPRP